MKKSHGISVQGEDYEIIPPAPSEDRGGITKTEYDKYNDYESEINQNKNDISQLFDLSKGGKTASGNSAYTIENAVDYPIMDIKLYGKSTQDGTPSPENPVDIVSVGDSGSVAVQACGKNLLDIANNRYTAQTNITNDGVLCNTVVDTKNYFSLMCRKSDWNSLYDDYIYQNIQSIGNYSFQIELSKKETLYFKHNGTIKDIKLFSITLSAGVYVLSFSCDGVDASAVNGLKLSNIQIEKGSTATDYEPYVGTTASITSALPLCGIPVSSGGNYTDSNGQQWIADELVFNADGSGKIVKYTEKIIFDGSDDEGWGTTLSSIDNVVRYRIMNFDITPLSAGSNNTLANVICDIYPTISATSTYIGTTGLSIDEKSYLIIFDADRPTLTIDEWKLWLSENPMSVVYQIAEPQEIELTATEMSELMQLQTYNGTTNIFNDSGAEMSVKYCTNGVLSEYVFPVVSGLQKQINDLNAAVLSLGSNV